MTASFQSTAAHLHPHHTLMIDGHAPHASSIALLIALLIAACGAIRHYQSQIMLPNQDCRNET
jgi:hypothetical protein